MLSCNNINEIQEKGIKLALLEDNLDFVIYYSSNPQYASNCAKIFTSLDYEKNKQYLNDLFTWIEDMNNVGAFEIYDYLKKAPADIICKEFLMAFDSAEKRKDREAKSTLLMLFEDNKNLKRMIRQGDIYEHGQGKTGDGGVSCSSRDR